MRNPKSFYENLAALAVGGTSLAFQLKDRNSNMAAAQLLQQQIEHNLLNRELLLAQREAALAERKAEFALQKAKELQELQRPPEIDKSSVFYFISDLLNSTLDFFNSLGPIHTSAVLNILIILTIIQIVINIFLIYLSDYYISKLNLELRYPMLARFLKARKAITKGSLVAYTLILGLVVIYGLLVNIAILVYF